MSSSDDTLDRFEAGRAISVAPARIEEELDSLWRLEAARADRGGKRAVTRACLWNLIVCTEGEERFQQGKRLIDELSASLPVRAIILRADPGDQAGELSAWVEANWRQQGTSTSGSDEVTLVATGRATARLPALVRALVLPDVPRALFWMGGPPPPGDSARELIAEVDRFVFDSRQLTDERGLAEYAPLAGTLELADLAWLGVAPLRGLCASLFDPPRDPTRLERLERVVVSSGVPGTQSRALLTLGWLAARLGWREIAGEAAPRRDRGTRGWRAKRRDGGALELELELATVPGAGHGVAELRLEADGEVWSLDRDRCITVHAPHLPDRIQPAASHSDGELLTAALGPRGRDPIYRVALEWAVRLVEAAVR